MFSLEGWVKYAYLFIIRLLRHAYYVQRPALSVCAEDGKDNEYGAGLASLKRVNVTLN